MVGHRFERGQGTKSSRQHKDSKVPRYLWLTDPRALAGNPHLRWHWKWRDGHCGIILQDTNMPKNTNPSLRPTTGGYFQVRRWWGRRENLLNCVPDEYSDAACMLRRALLILQQVSKILLSIQLGIAVRTEHSWWNISGHISNIVVMFRRDWVEVELGWWVGGLPNKICGLRTWRNYGHCGGLDLKPGVYAHCGECGVLWCRTCPPQTSEMFAPIRKLARL
jgi:hypothetical protein